jgi:hypothetical protein
MILLALAFLIRAHVIKSAESQAKENASGVEQTGNQKG